MKTFGLLGKNISYTFSPILHNHIFNFSNIDGVYKIFDISETEISNLLEKIKTKEIQGINVTTPYKTSVIKYLDELSPEAKSINAVNCVKLENGKLKGYNTDYYGIIKTFHKMGLILKNKKIVILGSGGAAKATIKAVLDSNGIPVIVSRTPDKTRLEFNSVSVISYDDLLDTSGFLLINATPIGTFPNVNISPVKKEVIQNFDFILDLIYNPEETLFLNTAKHCLKKFENGFYMLVSQGVKSEEIWNELSLNYNLIYEHLIKEIYNN
ncbi:shikimate dehydrogenase [uncultured Cetobacterium sp.]|uniref:shikimate dehydrogenase n=1 Tax=uncultured Cetobacterium sp. TaxID=527638 RepID=UPI002639AAF7|nr:shikimate dehydrogenase [uncultured Cetobacterium sp.]